MCHCWSQSWTMINSTGKVEFPRLKMQRTCLDRPRILLCIAVSVISLWSFVVESYLWIISLSVAVSVKAFEVILGSFCLSWARGITLVWVFPSFCYKKQVTVRFDCGPWCVNTRDLPESCCPAPYWSSPYSETQLSFVGLSFISFPPATYSIKICCILKCPCCFTSQYL